MPRVTQDYNLQTINPSLAKEWHPTKNGKLTPKDVSPNSSKKVWWICGKKHEWEATIQSRNNGIGCPYCAPRKVIKTWEEKRLKKIHMKNDATPPKGFVRKVGETSTGNILVEMSPEQWERLAIGNGLPSDLSEAMVSYRKQHGLTQFQLAEKIGISRGRLQEIERGLTRNLSFWTFSRVISTITWPLVKKGANEKDK